MADVTPGQPYTPTFAVTDANGVSVTASATGYQPLGFTIGRGERGEPVPG